MKCPIDGSDLVMTERQGIEIDYCPRCRGVWLDRGELDKLIERGDGYGAAPVRDDRASVSGMPRRDYDDDDDDYKRRYGHKRKKKGFLSDMFEF